MIETPSLLIQGIELLFLALSGILLLSVFTKPLFPLLQRTITNCIPRLSKILTSQSVSRFFVPLVFFTSFTWFVINIIMSWSNLQVIDVSISVIGLILWMIAYILVFASTASRRGRVGQIIGGVISALIIWRAIFIFASDGLAGGILIGIGVILIIVVIIKPECWSLEQIV